MADTFHELKAHDRDSEESPYNIGDIVELRKPRGILGTIKYIGPKRNRNNDLISCDTHYVIQLAEYLGNGNGKWDGYQYTRYLRPDKTMHLCKINNIRCKRSCDDILKALYNILRTNTKLKKQVKQQQNYITDLQDMNYKFEQHFNSQTYYFIPKKYKNNTNNNKQLSTTAIQVSTPHQLEFGGHLPSKSSLIPHSDHNNNNNDINDIDTSSSSSSEQSEQSELSEPSERVRSEKWVTLNGNNNNNLIRVITPPPHSHLDLQHKTHKTHKFNNSLTIETLQQKTRRSHTQMHQRNESEDYQRKIMHMHMHRHHQSRTFADEQHDEITPAPQYIDNINIESIDEQNIDVGEYINVKQKRKDIKQGKHNIDTHGKLQLYEREIEKQKSIEKMKNAKIVNSKVGVFERMIKENNGCKKNKKDKIMVVNDRNRESDNDNDIEDISEDVSDDTEKEGISSNDIGNYDDTTMIIHPDQLEALMTQSDQ